MRSSTFPVAGPNVFNPVSANLAIGTAAAFVVISALVSMTMDGAPSDRGLAKPNWMLRGTLAPLDTPMLEGASRPPFAARAQNALALASL